MPKISQTVINVVNRGLNKVLSEYLRVERLTLLWSRGKVCSRIPSSMDKLFEKLIPHRRVIIKEGPSAACEGQVTVCGRVVVMLWVSLKRPIGGCWKLLGKKKDMLMSLTGEGA